MRLLEIDACLRSSNNCLLIPCQGKNPDGSPHCCGMIRVPFEPTIGGTQLADAERYWHRVSGETLNDITLTPSIDAGECGHFNINNGGLEPA